MHPGQLVVTESLVRRLVDRQFPEWAARPLARVESTGTVNAIYRLGDDLVVRVPLVAEWAHSILREARWLPWLREHLPVEVPGVRGVGIATDEYPHPFIVLDWVPGRSPLPTDDLDWRTCADDLADLILAIRGLPRPDIEPVPTTSRGPVADAAQDVLAALATAESLVDVERVRATWDSLVVTPRLAGPPAWAHGDLLPANVLVRDGRLVAVIDWGDVGLGDPACDLMVAWNLLPAPARQRLRTRLDVDADMWARGRAWSLAQAVLALPYYVDSNPGMAAQAAHAIREVLSDDDSPPALRERLAVGIRSSMRTRDREAASALRSVLAALGNAEAVEVDTLPRAGAIEASAVGLGATEVERRRLGREDVAAVIVTELTERRAAAREYADLGRPERAEALRSQIRAIELMLGATALPNPPTHSPQG